MNIKGINSMRQNGSMMLYSVSVHIPNGQQHECQYFDACIYIQAALRYPHIQIKVTIEDRITKLMTLLFRQYDTYTYSIYPTSSQYLSNMTTMIPELRNCYLFQYLIHLYLIIQATFHPTLVSSLIARDITKTNYVLIY